MLTRAWRSGTACRCGSATHAEAMSTGLHIPKYKSRLFAYVALSVLSATELPKMLLSPRMAREYSPIARMNFTQRPTQRIRTRLRARQRLRVTCRDGTGCPPNEHYRSEWSLIESLTGFRYPLARLPAISRSFWQQATASRQLPELAGLPRGGGKRAGKMVARIVERKGGWV